MFCLMTGMRRNEPPARGLYGSVHQLRDHVISFE